VGQQSTTVRQSIHFVREESSHDFCDIANLRVRGKVIASERTVLTSPSPGSTEERSQPPANGATMATILCSLSNYMILTRHGPAKARSEAAENRTWCTK
jgi:hypothetical protein